MRLTQFRVRKFRNIIDSGPIDVEDDVTCLVGMNEAGKTAVLTALNRLNPADGSTFSVQDDYPRWLLVTDRRANVVEDTKPIEASFTLDCDDLRLVEAKFGEGVLDEGATVRVSVTYGTLTPSWTYSSVKHATAVATMLQPLDLPDVLKQKLEGVGDFPALLAQVGKEQESVIHGSEGWTQLQSVAYKVLHLTGGKRTIDAIHQLLHSRLPTFFYFSNFSLLEGRIDLSTLDFATQQRAGSTPEQTARSLLTLAGTTPNQLADDDYEDRRALLEAVGSDLTQQVFRYWKQNPHLRVRFDVDWVAEASSSSTDDQPPGIHTFLDIRVEDTRHSFTNNFSQRSSGFRWFFSFLAAFTEFEAREDSFVVLLDEPGLTLHARAQLDFLHFIEERLSEAAQVLYTTHSPFMVETNHIERVRIVEDGGPDTGATVSREVLRVGRDSLFPLQAALGYDVVQHLLIGDANLLVEGPSDFIYLDVMSRFLAAQGRPHLDADWRIMPAGGASNIPAFVALIGTTMDVTVLVDAGTEGAQRLQRAMEAGRLDRKRLVSVGEVTGTANSDIEDIFAIEDYLLLYSAAFGERVTQAALTAGDRVVKRLEIKEGRRFDHYKPAEALLRSQGELLKQLSQETLARWAALFERINASRR